ncbi:DNA-binding protein [Bacillus albus]|uniref:DNA-binding protein n=1 Tax=Bacillus albus TaxID=2026189 RepID=UPI00101F3A49|nr:DNA-binding protein [Bacillus albus]
MFTVQLEGNQEELKQQFRMILFEIADELIEVKKQESDLPVLLNKSQLAKHIFNVSIKSLDTHVICRADFPKMKVGERILFPRDMVINWVVDHVEVMDKLQNK